MNTKKICTFFLFAFFLLPLMSLAGTERYCYFDNFGNFYDFRGGKLGKKAFLIRVNQQLSGFATFSKLNDGYGITTFVSRDPAGLNQSYQISGFVDSDLETVYGVFDNLPRTYGGDGDITLLRSVCPFPESPTPAAIPRSEFGPGSTKQK